MDWEELVERVNDMQKNATPEILQENIVEVRELIESWNSLFSRDRFDHDIIYTLLTSRKIIMMSDTNVNLPKVNYSYPSKIG
jgi:hypothetical protein